MEATRANTNPGDVDIDRCKVDGGKHEGPGRKHTERAHQGVSGSTPRPP